MNARSLLFRGMLVGVAAGLLAFAFGWVFGEGAINSAIAFESAHAAPGVEEPEQVSRAVQSTLGLGVATLVYGAALGGIFALVFAFVHGRMGGAGARATSGALAVAGFVAVFLVPFLKYPANPPAVGNEDTIGRRSALYFVMILVSVGAAVCAALVRRSALARWGHWDATLVAVATFLVIVGAATAFLPEIDEVPADFSAAALWRFRVASIGTQLVLWTTLGILFGALTERAERLRAPVSQPAVVG
jgi:predicted cobalt transporter CbtA